jgi:PilZ domain
VRLCVLERRKLPRHEADWQVKLTGRNAKGVRYFGEGVLKNISAGGAFLYTDRSAHVGERLDISIRLPLKSENWLVYSAEVVRVDCACPRTGVAIKFDSSWPAFTDK